MNEYLPGGDLYSLLQNVGCFDEHTAKIYSLQILHALKYIHENGIIHRDLKPDNVLVGQDGRLKLIDFGLSHFGYSDRQVHKSNSEVVGTPDYIAPEIILNNSHSFTADYWSFGVLIYEFLVGTPPFHGKTVKKTFRNILTGKIDFGEFEECGLSQESVDIIKRLLVLNPNERLGANSVEEIMNHPWFDGVNLENEEPPFRPELQNEGDLCYFKQRYAFSAADDSDILLDMTDNSSNGELVDFPAMSVDKIIQQNKEIAKNVQHKKNISNKEIHSLLERQFRDDQKSEFINMPRKQNTCYRRSIEKGESIMDIIEKWMQNIEP